MFSVSDIGSSRVDSVGEKVIKGYVYDNVVGVVLVRSIIDDEVYISDNIGVWGC